MTQHTQTPWVAKAEKNRERTDYLIGTEDGHLAVALVTSWAGEPDEETCEANAAHIVRCVNEAPAKDALIKELVGALEALLGSLATGQSHTRKDAVKLSRAALTLAKGQ